MLNEKKLRKFLTLSSRRKKSESFWTQLENGFSKNSESFCQIPKVFAKFRKFYRRKFLNLTVYDVIVHFEKLWGIIERRTRTSVDSNPHFDDITCPLKTENVIFVVSLCDASTSWARSCFCTKVSKRNGRKVFQFDAQSVPSFSESHTDSFDQNLVFDG